MAHLTDVDLTRARLADAQLLGTDLTGALLTRAELVGVRWSIGTTRWPTGELEEAVLRRSEHVGKGVYVVREDWERSPSGVLTAS
ncbi:pentapeptide repeat-containing protein [Streptomyces sp. NPDC014995]|uniref:pentapeptide repeat-containing protein n=1 Tax=Streptomyces sp. NPDC014995 TaxID=3364936 RepID=UPI003702C7EB